MASPDVLDFAKLTAPISAEKPTGVDPRSDISPTSLYYQVKGARSTARAAERQTAGTPDAATPDWKPVREIGAKLLTEQAKDLEITTYMIEGLLRLEGFAGLRDGFRLARELVDKFWDAIFPMPDEEGLSTRIAPLSGLNGEDAEGTLIAPITRVPMTDATSVGRFTLAHYNEAKSLTRISDPKILQKKLEGGAVSLEKFQAAVTETPPKFYLDLVADLNACATEFTKLCEGLDKRCAGQGPPTNAIRTALTGYLDVVQDVAREKLRVAAPEAKKEEAPADAAGKPGAAKQEAGPTRESALESLQKVADFFRRTEPHSPLSYSLDQVVRWARMPLPDLLTELISDEAPRKSLFKQLGIRPDDKGAAPKK